jgi:hypothetical protein
MTRGSLFSTLLGAPFGLLSVSKTSAAETSEKDVITFPPGTVTIGPGGAIRIVGAEQVRIEGRTF